jgi:hypothetical protein
MKKLPSGVGWLIGVLIGIAIIVLCALFLEDGLATGIISAPVAAWVIGYAIEGQKKQLTAEQKKRTKYLMIIGLILLSISVLIGIYVWLR